MTAGLAVITGWLVLSTTPAAAHAFLVRTSPEQGARLSSAPDSITLEFSGQVGNQQLRITVNGRPFQPVRTKLTAANRIVEANLGPAHSGVYVVTWRVVADDGHETDGEFAFAVGHISLTVPSAHAGGQPLNLTLVVASWLFFLGLAVAVGALLTAMVVDQSVSVRGLFVRVGLSVALAGELMRYLTLIGDSQAAVSRDLLSVAISASLVCVAMVLTGLTPRRGPAMAAAVGAVVAWAAAGHAGADRGAVQVLIDAVHLFAAAAWTGALILVVAQLVHRDREDMGTLGRYARLAAVLVGVLAVTGLVSAWQLLPSVSALWRSRYGQLLLAKSTLFGIALLSAALARSLGLRRRRVRLLRGVTRVELSTLALVLTVTAVLVNTSPPLPATAAGALLGPPPLDGPIQRDAGLAGMLTVAVAAGAGQLEVQVFPPQGPANGIQVEIQTTNANGHDATLQPRPCGAGCFIERYLPDPGTTALAITASAPDWPSGTFRTAMQGTPPPQDPKLLQVLINTLRALPSMHVTEQVTSGPGASASPATFPIAGQDFLAAEPYESGQADDIRALPGQSGLSLYLSGSKIWVTMILDIQGRPARERVVDVGHVVTRTFTYP